MPFTFDFVIAYAIASLIAADAVRRRRLMPLSFAHAGVFLRHATSRFIAGHC